MTTDLLSHLSETLILKEQIAAGTLFVSYSRRNRDFAQALTAKLERMGFSVWRDLDDIDAGAEDWWQSIQEATALGGCCACAGAGRNECRPGVGVHASSAAADRPGAGAGV